MPAKGKPTKAAKPAKPAKTAKAATKSSKAKEVDPMEMHKKTGLPPSYFMKDLPKGGVY